MLTHCAVREFAPLDRRKQLIHSQNGNIIIAVQVAVYG